MDAKQERLKDLWSLSNRVRDLMNELSLALGEMVDAQFDEPAIFGEPPNDASFQMMMDVLTGARS